MLSVLGKKSACDALKVPHLGFYCTMCAKMICLYRDDQQFYEINKSVSTIQTKMAGLFSSLLLLIFFIISSPA